MIIYELIHFASCRETPEVWVFDSLSEPAKSTKFNFEYITFSDDSTLDLDSRYIVKIQCDL